MKRIYTPVTKIRRDIFTQVAKWSYNQEPYESLDLLPYKIIKGEVAKYRDSIFTERAIVEKRIKLALNLPVGKTDEFSLLSDSMYKNYGKFQNEHLIEIIPFACDACPTGVTVSDQCKRCLAHPCNAVCPVNAISFVNKKSYIDRDKCIKCGKCVNACPYNAIVKYDKPCSMACGVNAIAEDELGRAVINRNKCVLCGRCIVNCPFGAIADTSCIHSVISDILKGEKLNAIIAPAYVGQFGVDISFKILTMALISIGFNDAFEVAHGADEVAKNEAYHYLKHVGKDLDFLGTSCCPAWKLMVEKNFATISDSVSGKLTPMIVTAKQVKEKEPNSKVVFIGPCSAKKLEAQRDYVKEYVDYVLTFEELMGMFVAKKINFANFVEEIDNETYGKTSFYGDKLNKKEATPLGKGFPVVMGVANAICKSVDLLDDTVEKRPITKVDHADGLFACKKMMQLAKAGKRNDYLLEGLACPGGCVQGNGIIVT